VASGIVVLISGAGTTLQALIDSPLRPLIVSVGGDNPQAAGLEFARSQGIDAFAVDPRGFSDRAGWDAAILEAVAVRDPAWVVTAGFMRILAPAFVEAFEGRIVNVHPSLLPSFPGAHAVQDALDHGVRITGCTVHLVDQGVDTGPILAQCAVAVQDGDDVRSLHDRIKVQERRLLVDVMTQLAIDGGRG
jgi:phosphoribosylglycinamide formyltransferase-1